jgi:hypothetical protein
VSPDWVHSKSVSISGDACMPLRSCALSDAFCFGQELILLSESDLRDATSVRDAGRLLDWKTRDCVIVANKSLDRPDNILLKIGNQVLGVLGFFLCQSSLFFRAREIRTLLTPFIHDSFLISTKIISTKKYE